MHAHPSLTEEALCFAGILTLVGAEDLDFHGDPGVWAACRTPAPYYNPASLSEHGRRASEDA